MAIAWADISAVMSPRQYLGWRFAARKHPQFSQTSFGINAAHNLGHFRSLVIEPRPARGPAGDLQEPPGSTRPKHAVECEMANRMSTELRPSPQGVHVGIVGASG